MKPLRALVLLTALAGASLLTACSNDMSDLEQYVAEVKSRKSTAIDPLPQLKPYEAFVYIAGDRRDPFQPTQAPKPSSANAGANGIKPDMNRNKEPLEEFPLDGISMVGTITLNQHWYALVKAGDGVVHRVAVGDHMGQNFGQIKAISESEISLTEIIPDGFGGWMERPATVTLVTSK